MAPEFSVILSAPGTHDDGWVGEAKDETEAVEKAIAATGDIYQTVVAVQRADR